MRQYGSCLQRKEKNSFTVHRITSEGLSGLLTVTACSCGQIQFTVYHIPREKNQPQTTLRL